MVFVAGNLTPDSSRSLGMTVVQRSRQGRGGRTACPVLLTNQKCGALPRRIFDIFDLSLPRGEGEARLGKLWMGKS